MEILQTSLARLADNKRQVTTVAAISVATWVVFSVSTEHVYKAGRVANMVLLHTENIRYLLWTAEPHTGSLLVQGIRLKNMSQGRPARHNVSI